MNREALKSEMEKKHLSADQLAAKSGVDRSTIYRILNGESNCSIESARKIVTALNLSAATAKSIFFEKERA